MTHALARELLRRGHDVTLFAAPGLRPGAAGVAELAGRTPSPPAPPRCADVERPGRTWMAEHHAYLGLMLDLARQRRRALRRGAQQQPAPPPGRDGRDARRPGAHHPAHARRCPGWSRRSRLARAAARVRAPSAAFTAARLVRTSSQRRRAQRRRPRAVAPGPGGGPAVWSGRLVRGEGAARGDRRLPRRPGVPLVLAGPVLDLDYFDARSRRGSAATSTLRRPPRPAASWPQLRAARVGGGGDPGLGRALRAGRRRGDGVRHPGRGLRPRRRCPRSSTAEAGALAAGGRRRRLAGAIRAAAAWTARAVASHAGATPARWRDGRRATRTSTPAATRGERRGARA